MSVNEEAIKKQKIVDCLDRVTALLIEGLITDGGHHKQYYMEEALEELTGEKFYGEAKEEFQWEEGIAP